MMSIEIKNIFIKYYTWHIARYSGLDIWLDIRLIFLFHSIPTYDTIWIL